MKTIRIDYHASNGAPGYQVIKCKYILNKEGMTYFLNVPSNSIELFTAEDVVYAKPTALIETIITLPEKESK